MEADGHIGECRHLESDGVACDRFAWCDLDIRLPIEGDDAVGLGQRALTGLTLRDAHVADHDGFGSEYVREMQSGCIAADAGMHDLPHRLVVKALIIRN